MPPEYQAVVHAASLVVFERGEVGQGRGFGLVEDGLGEALQGAPAGPFEVGGVGDLPEQAAPFDDDAVNVARAEEVGNPALLVQGILVDGGTICSAPAPYLGGTPFSR